MVQQFVVQQPKYNYMKFLHASNITGGAGFTGVTVDGVTVLGDGLNTPLSAQFTQSGKYPLSGGISWSGTGYVYDVTATIKFVLNGITYGPLAPSPLQVTMAVADPTDNRIDAVVTDELGAITVITGTPSANPAYPTIPDDKVAIGYVFVEAGTTSPTILTDNIYLDNAEWVTSTYTTGSGSTGTIDFDSTVAPKQGSKCIDFVTNQRLGAKFTRATAIDVQQFSFVQVWYRNNGTAIATNKTPTIRFDNSLGNPVGNTVSLLTYGVSRTIVNTWQLAVIPVSAFGNITLVKGLRAIMTGGTLASQASFSLDFMLLSGGILPQGALGPVFLSPSNTLYSSGAATGATANTDSIFFGNLSGFQATGAENSIFLGTNSGKSATNADNSLFFGINAGSGASSAYSSVFQGTDAGQNALNAYQSVFIGRDAGNGATSAGDSFFLGYQAGLNASSASTASFLGSQAGSGATNASGAVFIGYQAGLSAVDSVGSVFIGQQAGSGATNTTPSIAIGATATPGAFNNSIAIGTAATSTRDNQFLLPASITSFKVAGLQSFASDAAAGVAGLVAGEWYYNTTTPAVDIKQ